MPVDEEKTGRGHQGTPENKTMTICCSQRRGKTRAAPSVGRAFSVSHASAHLLPFKDSVLGSAGGGRHFFKAWLLTLGHHYASVKHSFFSEPPKRPLNQLSVGFGKRCYRESRLYIRQSMHCSFSSNHSLSNQLHLAFCVLGTGQTDARRLRVQDCSASHGYRVDFRSLKQRHLPSSRPELSGEWQPGINTPLFSLTKETRERVESLDAHLISSSLTSNVSWLLAGMPGMPREP